MVQAYSPDLRSRVIKAAAGGLSARQAAERFGVGISTAIVWVRRYRQSGEAVARRQGKPRGSRLDAHESFILGLVEAGLEVGGVRAAGDERQRGVRVIGQPLDVLPVALLAMAVLRTFLHLED